MKNDIALGSLPLALSPSEAQIFPNMKEITFFSDHVAEFDISFLFILFSKI